MAAKGSGLHLLTSKTPETPCFIPAYPKEMFSALCIFRIQRDITNMYKEPPPGLHIAADENDITKVHALVVGPCGTPYEGGFFYFLISFTPDYPIKPPKVRLMTTGGGRVRFNPNLYANGMVCLSILGTWEGPAWSPAQTLSSLLISIQSLMNEKPYHNEPGYDKRERCKGDSKRYNEIIQHESLRVAVCEMLEGTQRCPPALKSKMKKLFLKYYESYCKIADVNMTSNGKKMKDPFGTNGGTFDYSSIKQRLEAIKRKIESEKEENDLDESMSDEEETPKLALPRSTEPPEIDDWVDFLYGDGDD